MYLKKKVFTVEVMKRIIVGSHYELTHYIHGFACFPKVAGRFLSKSW